MSAAALAAHQQAVTAGLAYLEVHASWSRRGTNGVEQIATAGLTAALFDHRTSREGDPQLHTYALVVNKALCTDGVWRSLDGREMFDHKKTAGMIYQTALRNEMKAQLGVEFGTVSIDGQAEIVGVPKELLTLWSKRTVAIAAEAGPKIAGYEKLLGRSLSSAERVRVTKTAVLKTRPGKTHTELATLKQSWTDEAATIGWTPARLLKAVKVRLQGRKTSAGHDVGRACGRARVATTAVPTRSGHAPHSPADVTDSLARDLAGVLPARSGQDSRPDRDGAGMAQASSGAAAGHLTRDGALARRALLAAGRKAAVFSRTDLAGIVAAHLPTSGLSAGEVVVRVEQLTDQALALTDAVPVGRPPRDLTPRASDPRYATLEVLQAEGRILSLARRGKGRGYGQTSPQHLRAAIHQPTPGTPAADNKTVDRSARQDPAPGDPTRHDPAAAGTGETVGSTAASPLASPVAGSVTKTGVSGVANRPNGAASSAAGGSAGSSAVGGGRHRLDAGQWRAVQHLTGSGDFLDVLTAPAGAGKTSTLGVASRAWTAAGHRVVGLAPSARAAAELAEATGGRTDTLAKWIHNHQRLDRLPAAERAWTQLDSRTVVIVDEASMASTLDLDQLTAAAGKAAAKVVLVGDPSQIGVINGPGGMLTALTHAGHGITLTQIHRFSETWERDASLQLRDGQAGCLSAYQQHGRLHPCPDSDTALEGVFQHWSRARGDGLYALMLARTRADVDALNTLARHAAQAAGDITGPVTAAGGRDWQAGDLLRTRRNNRSLLLDGTVGDGHVRNGDRYRVLGPGPEQGLIVEDLTGRSRVILPAQYLEQHCEYGWASTIDGAQGATAGLGIVLVRPGLDREHLYVAMTRGRHGNHAYITTEAATDPNHDHGYGRGPAKNKPRDAVPAADRTGWQDAAEAEPPASRQPAPAGPGHAEDQLPFGHIPQPSRFEQHGGRGQNPKTDSAAGPRPGPDRMSEPPSDPASDPVAAAVAAARAAKAASAATEQAQQVLAQAMTQTGAQDAAHTALNAARRTATDRSKAQAAQQKAEAQRRRDTPLPIPAEHQQTLARIEQLHAQQQATQARLTELYAANRATQAELDQAPKWARGRRRDLSSRLTTGHKELTALHAAVQRDDIELDQARRLADQQARDHRTAEAGRQRATTPTLQATLGALRPQTDLADPAPVPGPVDAGPTDALAAIRHAQQALNNVRPRHRPSGFPDYDPPRQDRGGPGLSR